MSCVDSGNRILNFLWLAAFTVHFFVADQLPAENIRSANADLSAKLPAGFQEKIYLDQSGEHRYLIFVPLDYTPNKKWPVVMFLHGAGQKGTDGIRPAIAGLGTALANNPQQPFIALFPQCENMSGRHLTCWLADSEDSQRALAMLREMEQEYSIDPQNRIISGWSMGGYGAWSLGAAYPELWAGILSISGGQTEKEVPLQALADSKIPVWAVHGAQDNLISADAHQQMVEQLNTLGGQGTFTLVEEAGHGVWQYLFSDPKVMNWLANPHPIEPNEFRDLGQRDPLPEMSPFYVENFTQLATLPRMFSLRMNNHALEVIAQGLPEILPASALSGQLQDIKRELESGEETIEVSLSDISFDCQVRQVVLRAISGGRFLARFHLNPLRLSIGHASLKSRSVQASTGEFEIRMGHRDPVILELQIQPDVDATGLHLSVLKQSFSIPDNNWHIIRPKQVEVDSDVYSKDNIVTGIVGGLYLQREQIESTVLEAVPSFLKVVESELQARETPRLARLLWPLPALIPDLSIAPSQVQTDTQGISIVFDMLLRTTSSSLDFLDETISATQNSQLNIDKLPKSDALDFQISLAAIDGIGRLVINEGFAYINVLDLQESELTKLAKADVLHRIFPEYISTDSATEYDVGLRLEEPFRIRPLKKADHAKELVVELHVPRVAFEVKHPMTSEMAVLHFSLKQRIHIKTIEKEGVPQSLEVLWHPDAEVEILDTPDRVKVDEQKFRDLFSSAWEEFSVTLSSRERNIPRVRFGNAALGLKSIQVQDQIITLGFTATTIEAE